MVDRGEAEVKETKKIGILTFPNSISYGATLQMFALCRAVEKLGYDTEYINYHNAFMKKELHIRKQQKHCVLKQRIYSKLRMMMHQRLYKKFKKFEKTIPHYPSNAITDSSALETLSARYSGIICGSDQVWNPDITNYDLSFFLDFCKKDTKRISYAPSFGVENLPEEYQKKATEELKKFSDISIREENGEKMLRQMIGEEVPVVLDPTFLLTREEWIAEEQIYSKPQERYILYYTVRSSDALFEFCQKLAGQHQMKIVRVGGNVFTRHFQKDKNVEYACDVSPREWLSLMHHADCVVTNSFHGAAFAINYRKNFFVQFFSMTNSRLEHLIGMLDLESRIVNESTDIEQIEVDYSICEKKLANERENSWKYLVNALKKCE